jgi:hypothetical protein
LNTAARALDDAATTRAVAIRVWIGVRMMTVPSPSCSGPELIRLPRRRESTRSGGDGSVTTGTAQEANGSGTVTGSHPYTKGGSYSDKLTVTDDDAGAAVVVIP